MYLKHPTLISRPMPGLSGVVDAIKAGGSAVFDVFASAEQAKGAAQALQMQQQLNAQQGGIKPMTIILLGGLGVGAYFLLRKKKS